MSTLNHLAKYIPAIRWMRTYNSQLFKGDLNAGATVGVMLIPQGMAYAVLAGLPPVYGLYASIVPILLYALLGTSRQLAVGPVAMVSLLVLAGVSEFADAGSERFIQLAILTALGVGIVQLLMGIFKMGFLVNFLSHPVLAGFTSAAAIIIGASQLKSLLGLEIPGSKMVYDVMYNVVINITEVHMITMAIGIGSVVIIQLLRSWKRSFPSALVVVFIGTLITALFGLNEHGVHIVGDIPGGLPGFLVPQLNFADLSNLLPIILVISLVGYMESIAIAKSIAGKHGYKIDANQELVALGTANIGGAFFQAFPTTGGLSRTAVNNQAGSVSGMASIISAGIIILTLLFLTPLFYYLPVAVLAAIIIVAVSGLFDWQTMKHLMKTDRRDLAMLAVTFLATLLLGIEEGIATGVFVSLTMLIYQSTRPHSAVLGQLGQSKNYRNVQRYPEAETSPDLLIFRFDSPLFFTNATAFSERLGEQLLHKDSGLKHLILDASAMSSIDSTGIHALEELVKETKSRGVKVLVAGAIGPFRDKLVRCGLLEEMGVENFFFDVAEAVESLNGNWEADRRFGFHPNQTNIR